VDNSGVEPGPPHLQSQWLSTWAMAQHCKLIWLSHCFSIYILDMPCWQMKRNLKKKKKKENWVANINQNSNFLCNHLYHLTVTIHNLLHPSQTVLILQC
jgi:hypothetical protein